MRILIFMFALFLISCAQNSNKKTDQENSDSIAANEAAVAAQDTAYKSAQEYFNNIDWKEYSNVYQYIDKSEVGQILGVKFYNKDSIDFILYVDNKECKSEFSGTGILINDKFKLDNANEKLIVTQFQYKTKGFQINVLISKDNKVAKVEMTNNSAEIDCKPLNDLMQKK